MKSGIAAVSGVVLVVSLSLVSPGADAMDVGLGVSVNTQGEGDGGYGVSLPLRFGSIMVEPELSFYSRSYDETYPTSPANNRSNDYTSYTLETGVYWRQPVVPTVETYVGGRLGYSKYDNSYTYPNSPGSNYSYKESGIYVGPTLGAEYFFNKHFSLGLDVSLLYQSTSYDYNGGTPYKQDGNRFDYQTRTRLRFYF